MNAQEVKVKKKISLGDEIIKRGTTITVSKRDTDYILWHHTGIYSLPNEYVGKTIRIISIDDGQINDNTNR